MIGRSKLNIESYVNDLAESVVAQTQATVKQETGILESVLKGLAVALWSDAAGRLFIVADEEDARRLGEPRGTVYTAAEVRCVIQVQDPAVAFEIHEWKRKFNASLREYQGAKRGTT
jgi:hypothetical protein